MNPSFVPVIGSGFDEIARQQALWAGMNNEVDRANLNSVARASEQQNDYFDRQQQFAQENARQQAAANEAAARRQQDAYQFGANLNENQSQAKTRAEIDRAKISAGAAEYKYEQKRQDALIKAQNDFAAATNLASKGHYRSREEIQAVLPDATPTQVDDLWETNQQAHQEIAGQYQFASGLAKAENRRGVLAKNVAGGNAMNPVPAPNEWWNPMQWLGIGALSRWAGGIGVPKPDTSWFDAYQNRLQSANKELETYDSAKGGVGQFGVIQDLGTGRYSPIGQPQWTQAQQPAPAKPAIKLGTVYKGYIYIGGDPKSPDSWKPQSQ